MTYQKKSLVAKLLDIFGDYTSKTEICPVCKTEDYLSVGFKVCWTCFQYKVIPDTYISYCSKCKDYTWVAGPDNVNYGMCFNCFIGFSPDIDTTDPNLAIEFLLYDSFRKKP